MAINKFNCKLSSLAAAKRILNNAKEEFPFAKELHYVNVYNDKQIINDKYSFIILSKADKLPLPEMPKEIKAISTINYKNITSEMALLNKDIEFKLPNVFKLKIAIKKKKAEIPAFVKDKRVYFAFENNPFSVSFNAECLLNMLELFGDCKTYISYISKTTVILFENKNNSIGILIPAKDVCILSSKVIALKDLQ